MLEDASIGFGHPLTITNPEGDTNKFIGCINDISQNIGPDTGLLISGRSLSITLRISTLSNRGFSLPKRISKKNF